MKELVVCGDRLNCQTSSNYTAFDEASMPYYFERGQAAHRAFTEYWRFRDPREIEWKANRTVFGVKDPTRPDLVYDNGIVGGVWELKPAFSPKGEIEARIYAQSLNMVHRDGRFAPGTNNGAPSPLIPGPLTDLVTGRTFIYTFDNIKGAIYYTELPLSQPTAVDIKNREPNPTPIIIPFAIPLKLIDKLIKVPIVPILIIDPSVINEEEMY